MAQLFILQILKKNIVLNFKLDRKRHIGNDIVNIVFIDGSFEETALFQPQFIKSHFTHIYAVVCYQVSISSTFYALLFDVKVFSAAFP